MKLTALARTLGFAAALVLGASAQAAVVGQFVDDFENGLGKWADAPFGGPYAAIVADPLNAANRVLTFSRVGLAGSVFSRDVVAAGGRYVLGFDYLGMPRRGRFFTEASGGFIGVAEAANPFNQDWVAGTGGWPGLDVLLADDGRWHRYELTLAATVGSPVRLMLEDYLGAGLTAGNAYFDNVSLRDAALAADLPLPGSLSLTAAALAGAMLARRRRRG